MENALVYDPIAEEYTIGMMDEQTINRETDLLSPMFNILLDSLRENVDLDAMYYAFNDAVIIYFQNSVLNLYNIDLIFEFFHDSFEDDIIFDEYSLLTEIINGLNEIINEDEENPDDDATVVES